MLCSLHTLEYPLSPQTFLLSCVVNCIQFLYSLTMCYHLMQSLKDKLKISCSRMIWKLYIFIYSSTYCLIRDYPKQRLNLLLCIPRKYKMHVSIQSHCKNCPFSSMSKLSSFIFITLQHVHLSTHSREVISRGLSFVFFFSQQA